MDFVIDCQDRWDCFLEFTAQTGDFVVFLSGISVLCVWHLVQGQSIEKVESSLISPKCCEFPLHYSVLAFFWLDPWACDKLVGGSLK